MRSRTDAPLPVRAWLERVARVVAWLALLAALRDTWQRDAAAGAVGAAAATLPDTEGLAAQLADGTRGSLRLDLADVPDAAQRALLQAAREAGVAVSWAPAAGRVLPPLALAVAPRADPQGGSHVRVAADRGRVLVLEDTLGWLDSARVRDDGVAWTVDGAARAFAVRAGGTVARATAPVAGEARRLRLLAAPGWDARFTVLALEESGWRVDAEFEVAPRVTVRAGAPATLDTSRYAAVIALDSTAWRDAAAITRFVRQGGGLLLMGAASADAPSADAPSGLPRTGVTGALSPGIPGALRTPSPMEGLALHPVARLDRGAVALERSTRPGAPVSVAARRVGGGRVVQAGWQDTWAWRMLGGDDAVEAHRTWWRVQVARAIGGAAPPPVWTPPYPGDAAPLADLVARVGPAGSAVAAGIAGAAPTPAPRAPSPGWMGLAVTLLLAEWWSRRLRGVR